MGGILQFPDGTKWKITEKEDSYDISEIAHEDIDGKTQIVLKPLISKKK